MTYQIAFINEITAAMVTEMRLLPSYVDFQVFFIDILPEILFTTVSAGEPWFCYVVLVKVRFHVVRPTKDSFMTNMTLVFKFVRRFNRFFLHFTLKIKINEQKRN